MRRSRVLSNPVTFSSYVRQHMHALSWSQRIANIVKLMKTSNTLNFIKGNLSNCSSNVKKFQLIFTSPDRKAFGVSDLYYNNDKDKLASEGLHAWWVFKIIEKLAQHFCYVISIIMAQLLTISLCTTTSQDLSSNTSACTKHVITIHINLFFLHAVLSITKKSFF